MFLSLFFFGGRKALWASTLWWVGQQGGRVGKIWFCLWFIDTYLCCESWVYFFIYFNYVGIYGELNFFGKLEHQWYYIIIVQFVLNCKSCKINQWKVRVLVNMFVLAGYSHLYKYKMTAIGECVEIFIFSIVIGTCAQMFRYFLP